MRDATPREIRAAYPYPTPETTAFEVEILEIVAILRFPTGCCDFPILRDFVRDRDFLSSWVDFGFRLANYPFLRFLCLKVKSSVKLRNSVFGVQSCIFQSCEVYFLFYSLKNCSECPVTHFL